MRLITLITDFGIRDEYIGLMKGVILSINNNARIIDISHYIEPQNVVQAAYMINSSFSYFPKGTIHVVVVDPGVGTKRSVLALKAAGHIFLAPDNGTLSFQLNSKNIERIVRVENERFFLSSVSCTFHGRDIFAPAAAHISKGTDISCLGPCLKNQDTVKLPSEQLYCKTEEKNISGRIIYADRFGNLITNIDSRTIESFCGNYPKNAFKVHINNKIIRSLSQSYQDVKQGKPLAVIGSRNYLEIAVNCGSAAEYFNITQGGSVYLKI